MYNSKEKYSLDYDILKKIYYKLEYMYFLKDKYHSRSIPCSSYTLSRTLCTLK